MARTDLIADMLTMIRNAVMAKKESVAVPASKINTGILEILKNQGYIENYRAQEAAGAQNKIKVYLKYDADKKYMLQGIKRISKSSLRVYSKAQDIKPVLRGFGVSIISTSGGLITDKEARQKRIGGEVLCQAW